MSAKCMHDQPRNVGVVNIHVTGGRTKMSYINAMKRFLLSLSLLFLASCGRLPNDSQTAQAVTPLTPLATIVREATEGEESHDLAELVTKLGTPRLVETVSYPNKYEPGQTDGISTLHYDGLNVMVYEAYALSKVFIISLKVSSDAYVSPEGVRVGDRAVELERKFGRTLQVEGDERTYALGDFGNTVKARLEDGLIHELTWQFYWE